MHELTQSTKRLRSYTQTSQILTKTQIALQAIKKYQARNNTLMTQKTKYLLSSPYTIFREIDQHYTRLHFHKQLKVDKVIRVQIMPFNEEYFSIDTSIIIFPVRIFIKNVKNQGTLYVGFDKEYPGVDRMPITMNQDGRKSDRSRTTDKNQSQKRIYDSKFVFDKDIMCVLKNQKKKPIHKIYLTVVAKKQLLMFNIKFDYVGYQGMPMQQNFNRTKRVLTQGNIFAHQGFELPSSIKRNTTDFLNSFGSSKQIQLLKRSNTQGPIGSPMRKKILKSLSKQRYAKLQSNTATEQQQQYQQKQRKDKNFIQQNLNSIQTHKRQNSRQLLQQKKQKSLQSKQRIKANREQLQQFKQKQLQIKEAASKLKKSIQQYQRIYREDRIRDVKMLHMITPLIYLSIFMHKSNRSYNVFFVNIVEISNFFVTYFQSQIFGQKIYKIFKETISKISLMHSKYKARSQMSCFLLFQLGAKVAQPSCYKKASQLIFQAFTDLQPALVLNHALNQSSKYRQSVKVIQRRWLLKYKARLMMLENFSMRHLQAMFKQYPHLKLANSTFKNGNYCRKVCYEYMTDQSIKFKNIHNAYRKRVQEIDEFIAKNLQIMEYNKGKPESKKRAYLDIPVKPFQPQHRFFRNLDILKSMLRGWFQIEYKKILKKNISGK